MKLAELITYLESVAPLSYQEDYDNAGLITGHPDWEIKAVMVSLDATEAVIDEAIEKGCNVLVSHHPIVFTGVKKINGYNYIEKSIIKAIKNDVALYAIHTNLDNVMTNGVNEKIAQKLGLTNSKILAPKLNLHPDGHIGSGLIGNLERSMTCKEFLAFLKESMQTNIIKHTELHERPIDKIAVCGGSGKFLLETAISHGADAFVSSDFKYHEYFDANGEIVIADIGHYESEKYTIELLFGLISNNFSNFAAHYTTVITNPVKYF